MDSKIQKQITTGATTDGPCLKIQLTEELIQSTSVTRIPFMTSSPCMWTSQTVHPPDQEVSKHRAPDHRIKHIPFPLSNVYSSASYLWRSMVCFLLRHRQTYDYKSRSLLHPSLRSTDIFTPSQVVPSLPGLSFRQLYSQYSLQCLWKARYTGNTVSPSLAPPPPYFLHPSSNTDI